MRIYGTCRRVKSLPDPLLPGNSGDWGPAKPEDCVVLPNHLDDALDKRLALTESIFFSPGDKLIGMLMNDESAVVAIPFLDRLPQSFLNFLGFDDSDHLEIWSTIGRNQLLRIGKYRLNALSFAQDETRIAMGSDDTLTVWDLPASKSSFLLLGLVVLPLLPLFWLITWKS